MVGSTAQEISVDSEQNEIMPFVLERDAFDSLLTLKVVIFKFREFSLTLSGT